MTENMKRCPKCHARNDPEAIVCSLCQASLAAPAETYEPRLWQDGKQRFRGETTVRDGAPLRDAAAPEAAPVLGAPPASQAPRGDRHFLLAPIGEPLQLDLARGVAVFGRDAGCDVRVGSASVSRRHAELRLHGEPARVVVRDLGSQNGTFVNGGLLEQERALADGDVLKLGELVVVYKRLAPGEDESRLRGYLQTVTLTNTVRLAVTDLPPAEGGGIEGDASIIQVHEILRRLGGLHANGKLSLDVGGIKGTMMLQDGKVTTASYAGLDGLPAIQAMAALTKGRYRYEPDPHTHAAGDAPTQEIAVPGRLEAKKPTGRVLAPAPVAVPAPEQAPASAAAAEEPAPASPSPEPPQG